MSTRPTAPDASEQASSQQNPLDLLRELIVGPETNKLDKIEQRLDDPQLHATDIAHVLPDAVNIRVAADDKLQKALQPVVEDAIRISVSRDPRPLSDALFPVMGTAIRKAISSTLSAMMQSLNQTLEHAFSVQGLKWRLESLRTGRSFAEIVMLNTLVYRVEQVFLIHRETGLLLQHVMADQVKAQDADMVSGMMTAVQDFVRDSFEVGESDALEEMQVGELRVWMEAGPKAILAVCLRGSAPKQLRTTMQEVNESVHHAFAHQLNDFSGDVDAFADTHSELAICLQAQYASTSAAGTKSRKIPVIVTAIMLGIICWLGWGYFQHQRFMQLVTLLKQESGLVVVEFSDNSEPFYITGLSDPLAGDPAVMVHSAGYAEGEIELRFSPYQSLQDAFVLKRAANILAKPDSVVLHLEQGVLYATGSAPQSWIDRAGELAPLIAGVSRFDAGKLDQLYSDSWILQRAAALLQPPASVQLSAKNRILFARGESPEVWIKQARSLVPTIISDLHFNTDDLINMDTPEYILSHARQGLAPPSSVRLSLTGEAKLLAAGTASTNWIAQARAHAGTLYGISAYDDSGVADSGSDDFILAEAHRKLQPPASVKLAFTDGILQVAGKAGERWIKQSGTRVKSITGVRDWDISQLINTDSNSYILTQARLKLDPPASVTLDFDNGVLKVSGKAEAGWVQAAEGKALSVDGVSLFDASGMQNDNEEKLALLRKKLAAIRVAFRPQQAILEDDQLANLQQIIGLIKEALPILEGSGFVLQVAGHTSLWGLSSRKKELALERAKNVRSILLDQGLPKSLIVVSADASGGNQSKSATFSLQANPQGKSGL